MGLWVSYENYLNGNTDFLGEMATTLIDGDCRRRDGSALLGFGPEENDGVYEEAQIAQRVIGPGASDRNYETEPLQVCRRNGTSMLHA